MAYSEKIVARLAHLTHCRELPDSNAEGTGVNLACGSTVRFFVRIEEAGRVFEAAFRSNGCGHSRASADVLAEWVTDKQLVDLHGLDNSELREVIQTALGEIPDDRKTCVVASIDAMRAAFADHRTRQIDEFSGEKALICTCFGVTEEKIESLIAKSQLTSVEQITDICNAGGGCGSCRMLIREMLDSVL